MVPKALSNAVSAGKFPTATVDFIVDAVVMEPNPRQGRDKPDSLSDDEFQAPSWPMRFLNGAPAAATTRFEDLSISEQGDDEVQQEKDSR